MRDKSILNVLASIKGSCYLIGVVQIVGTEAPQCEPQKK